MRIALTFDKKEIFTCYGIGAGKYFIGIGLGDDARIATVGLVQLIGCIYIRVPYKYRKYFNAEPKQKAETKPDKIYRLDLNLWEQKTWYGWTYKLFRQKPLRRLFRINPTQARYLVKPYQYSNVR